MSIVWYNLNRQQFVLTRLLHNPALANVDVLLLQETPRTLHHTLPHGWHPLLPTLHNDGEEKTTHPRSIALIHPRIIHATCLLAVPSRDIVAIDVDLRADEGNKGENTPKSIRVVGVYNPHSADPDHNATIERDLPSALTALPVPPAVVVAGDFNLHHPLWEPSRPIPPSEAAEAAVQLLGSADLHLVLPPDTPTFFPHNKQAAKALDLVFANLNINERIISCDVADNLESGSDHRPLLTTIDLSPTVLPPFQPRPLFRKANRNRVEASYALFSALIPPPSAYAEPNDINREGENLTSILAYTTSAAVPLSRPAPPGKANTWWTEQIAEACAEARRKQNQAFRLRKRRTEGEAGSEDDAARRAAVEDATQSAKMARNRVKALCRRGKFREDDERLKEVTPVTVWREVKTAKGESAKAPPTPPLRKGNGTYATTDREKLEVVQPFLLPTQPEMREVSDEKREGVSERDEGESGDAAEGSDVRSTSPPLRIAWSGGPPISQNKVATFRQHSPNSAGESPPTSQSSSPSSDSCPAHPSSPSGTLLPWPILEEEEIRRAIFSSRPHAAPGADGIPNSLLQLLWPLLRSRLVPLFQACYRLGHFPAAWKDAVGIVLRKPKKPDYSNPKAYRLIAFERTLAKALEKTIAARFAYLGEERGLEAPNHFGGRRARAAEDAVVCAVDTIKRQQRNGKVVIGIALDVASAFPSVKSDALDRDLRDRGLPAAPRSLVQSWLSRRTCTLHLGSETSASVRQEGLPQGSPLSPAAFKIYNSAAIEACESEQSTCYGWIDDLNLFAWGDTVDETVSFLNQRIIPRLEMWSNTHSSVFEPLKTVVVLFLPTQAVPPLTPPAVVLCGVPLPYSPALTMLGAVLDSRLTFESHVAIRVQKASQSLNAVRVLVGARRGLRAEMVRLLLLQTVMVQLLWMGAVWWKGERAGKKMRLMEGLQKEVARVICGGFKSTSREALEIEAGLPPIHDRLALAQVRLAVRIRSSPPSHPLRQQSNLASAALIRCMPKFPSPIHFALSAPFLAPTDALETIYPHAVAPWSPEPAATSIVAETKEEAREAHDEVLLKVSEQDMVVYTDGSLMEEHSGAGVALRIKRDGEVLWATRSRSLGLSQGVYQAELEGLRLALSFIPVLTSPSATSHVHIFADNSSAISLPFDPRPSSAQYLRLDIRQHLLQLQRSHPLLSITFHWIAGHIGVEGNEMADGMARRGSEDGIEATAAADRKKGRRRVMVMPRKAIERSLSSLEDEGSSYWEQELSGVAAARLGRGTKEQLDLGRVDDEGRIDGGNSLPKSAAACLQAAKAALKSRWEQEWATTSVGAALRAIDPSSPFSAFRRRLRSLPRPQATLLSRLRTDFSSLAQPLHRATLHPTGLCDCGESESREHFFLHCPLYSLQRSALLSSLPTRHLPPLSSLLSSEAFLPAVITFINATDRFPRLYATVLENGGTAVKRRKAVEYGGGAVKR